MSAAATERPRPLIRQGQGWLFKGQRWRVHEILAEGVVVLMGPSTRRGLEGVTSDELYEAGELEQEAPPLDKAAERLAKAFEKAQERARNPRRKRIKKPPPPPAPRAWACRILAVDTARNSGWAIWDRGVLRAWGEIDKDDDVALKHLCVAAVSSRDGDAQRTVLVLEAAAGFVYQGRSAATLTGLGKAHQAWERAWRDGGGLKTRIVRVKPTRWRGQLFGRSHNTFELERQFAMLSIREAIQHAFNHPGPDRPWLTPAGEPRPDARAAICVGRCACYLGEVGAALPMFLRVTI